MPTLQDLRAVNLKQLDVTIAESALLLQKEGGLDGELKTSGSICERFIRETLRDYLVPGQFRVTSGFIATPKLLRDKKNLPQCDVLLVERDATPMLRLHESGIEVVPRQSVCGLIEVKRTLNPKTLKDALTHIADVVASLEESASLKTDKLLNRINKNVLVHNFSSDKPLLGIIALQSTIENLEDVAKMIAEGGSLVDFVWTVDGSALFPGFVDNDKKVSYYTHTARPETREWSGLTQKDFVDAPAEYFHIFNGKPLWCQLTTKNCGDRATVFARVVGLVTLMLLRVFATPLREQEINDYYFPAA